ncbi:hypothetical protein [Sphingobacterium sp. UME9]|uniref:hypothetical protein n=1 Tax=Sphingobacterium sp. UME9 TaxID=1862316 RepID=UPI001604561F|nr:hypothetical protein [Sphingobacterium sp. UME9]
MKFLKVLAQGIMHYGDTPILVYKLEDGTLAVNKRGFVADLVKHSTTKMQVLVVIVPE